jgi:SAM-dependent methyltransferase
MVREEVSNAIYKNLPENGIILDAGCGDLEYTKYIASHNPNVISCDIYEPNSEKCTNTRFLLASMEQLPFRNESFDFIICLSALQYIYDDKIVVSEFNRVLKKGGKVLITVPTSRSIFRLLRELEIKYNVYRSSQYGIKHHHYYYLNDIYKFEELGFCIAGIQGYNFNFIPRLIIFISDIAAKNLPKKFNANINTHVASSLKKRKAAIGEVHIRPKFHYEGKLELIKSNLRFFFREFAYHFLIIMEKENKILIVFLMILIEELMEMAIPEAILSYRII